MTTDTITVTNPDNRAECVYMRPAAWTALHVYTERLRARCDDGTPWDGQADINRVHAEAETDPVLAQLVEVAEKLAAGVGDAWDVRNSCLGASALVTEHNRIDPLPPRDLSYLDESDTCRHGRPFTADCADCEI